MLEKLEAIIGRYKEVEGMISDPEVMSDMDRYIKLSKEYKELGPLVEAAKVYKDVLANIDSSKEILSTEKDEEFRQMAKAEMDDLSKRKEQLDEEIKIMLIPKNPEDEKNAVMEIRAGTGGDEASIFAGDLHRMYVRFCENSGWKTNLVDRTEGTVGGYKEIIFNVTGAGAYGILKFESGVHRVQRVPQTETQGRVHTSAASVVVLPEAEEFDIELDMHDVRRDEFCSSGPGGQSVNTTYSAIRLTHEPTGIVVQCQDEKSKLKNYEKALKVLRSRIYELELRKIQEEEGEKRKSMVSTGDRSAKIRTYNWPQGRVTDHRIGLNAALQGIIDGSNLMDMIEALQVAENAERLKEGVKEDA